MSESKASQHSRLTTKGLRSVFLACILMGMTLVALLAFYEIAPFIALVCTACIMMVYWLVYIINDSPTALRETFSDSVYYLGFLLTIISLLAAMISFGASGQELNAYNILSQFGMALISTFVGMLLRVYYNQFEVSLHSARMASEDSLEKATTKFSVQMQLVSNNLAQLIKSTDAVISNAYEQSQASEELIQESTGSFVKLADEIIPQLTQQFEKAMLEVTKSTDEVIKLLPKNLSSATEQSKYQIDALTKSLEQQLEKVANASGAAIQAAFEKANNNSASVAHQLEQMASHLSELVPGFSDIAQYNKESASHIANINSDLATSGNKIDSLNNGIQSLLTSLSTKVDELVKSDARVNDELTAAMAEYTSFLGSFKKKLLESNMDELISNETALLTKISSHNNLINELNTNLSKHNQSLIENSNRLTDNLSETSKFIVDELSN